MTKKEKQKRDMSALLFFLILAIFVNVPGVFAQDDSPLLKD